MTTLADAVWAILVAAAELYADSPTGARVLDEHIARFGEPLRIAVVGPARSGKSTMVGALRAEPGPVTYLDDGPERDADALLYLSRDVAGPGLAALRRPDPIHTILVLSRADEVDGGRVDALTTARQLARRYRREAPVRAACQSVVAVSGLLGLAGSTLREPEYAALRALAARPRVELDEHLLSADRFTGAGLPVDLDRAVRAGLLARFGLPGVRLAVTLVRTGDASREVLAAELIRRSGLTELRESVARLFLDRCEVLKARAALQALGALVRAEPRPGARRLLMDLDRATANAHDFRELRLLAALRSGRTTLPPWLDHEARRLLGGAGTAIGDRLAASAEPSEAELWALGADALARWREQTENVAFSEDQRRAARLVVRSCEGLLTELASG